MYLMDKLCQYGLITLINVFFNWCNSTIQIHFHWWVEFIHMANHMVNFIRQHIYPCHWDLMWYPSSSVLSTSSKWSFWFTKLTCIHIEIHPCGELHPNKNVSFINMLPSFWFVSYVSNYNFPFGYGLHNMKEYCFCHHFNIRS
jgi:hypothetical protein